MLEISQISDISDILSMYTFLHFFSKFNFYKFNCFNRAYFTDEPIYAIAKGDDICVVARKKALWTSEKKHYFVNERLIKDKKTI